MMKRRNNKPNPDNRADNAQRIQENMNSTIGNIEAAEEMMANTPDAKMKTTLSDKNERRRRALDGMQSEMRDETKK